MTVQKLIDELNRIEDKTLNIQIGCQGYTTADDPMDEYGISVYQTKDSVFITAMCRSYPGDGTTKHREYT